MSEAQSAMVFCERSERIKKTRIPPKNGIDGIRYLRNIALSILRGAKKSTLREDGRGLEGELGGATIDFHHIDATLRHGHLRSHAAVDAHAGGVEHLHS